MNRETEMIVELIAEVIRKSTLAVIEDVEQEMGKEISKYNINFIIDTMRYHLNYAEEILTAKLEEEYLSDENPLLTEKEFAVIRDSKGMTFKETIHALDNITENMYIKKAKMLLDNEVVELDDATVTTIEALLFDISTLIAIYNKEKIDDIREEVNQISSMLIHSN